MTQYGQIFNCKSNLKRHLKSHLGIKDNKCDQCGKLYSSDRSLQQHITRVHLGQREFECELCEKTFTRIASLKVNNLTHTNEVPFKCEYCPQGYKEKRNLMKHIERQHIQDEDSQRESRQEKAGSSHKQEKDETVPYNSPFSLSDILVQKSGGDRPNLHSNYNENPYV